jgi:outer membrane protein assembly factor BamB
MLVLLLALAISPACDSGSGTESVLPEPLPHDVSADILTSGEVWHREVIGCGVSSPRLFEIDGDGVLDIVLGAGKELQWGAILALSGADGSELWRLELADQSYATPCLIDVDGDGSPDVVSGRRVGPKSGLVAINGKTGERLWGVHGANPDADIAALHFNTTIPCPDVDGDGRPDLLALQGGADDENREPGWMHLIKSDTGRILKSVPTPDGLESFFVPSIERLAGEPPRYRVLIGTGGETLPGHLFSLDFPELTERWRFSSGKKKGFVAGGLLYDFDGSGRDAVVSSFNSVMSRLDGETGEVVWQVRNKRCETYVTPTPGHFGGDGTIDIVSLFSEGRWPSYTTRNLLQWVDGRTGEVLKQHDRGVQASSSPVVFDMNGDGWDEVLLVSNLSFGINKKEVPCQLDLYDGGPGKALLATRQFMGYSAGTPWIGHLDDDGQMDVVFVHLNNVYRISLGPVPAERIYWNQYRGEAQDGVVPFREWRRPQR